MALRPIWMVLGLSIAAVLSGCMASVSPRPSETGDGPFKLAGQAPGRDTDSYLDEGGGGLLGGRRGLDICRKASGMVGKANHYQCTSRGNIRAGTIEQPGSAKGQPVYADISFTGSRDDFIRK